MDANKKHDNGNGRATPGGSYFVPLTDGEPVMAYPVAKPAYAATAATTNPNPYVQMTPAAGSGPMDTVTKMLGRCGRMLEDGTRKVVGITGNGHHITTSPSPCDAAMTRLAQGTKLLAEGGHDKIFHHRFGVLPGEKLRKAYACYLSTTSGPVIGTLYVSTMRLAFCSDNPLCLNPAVAPPEWVYYKVVVQLDKLRQ
ncbi:GLABRA2 expression modulator-like [Iris pallida]|uniref:GLABRA2 expression modulator-like n=1 Tax=Iris pallida TaxID=29817 RepID=A0AAX6DFL9_IRIPA|nr:GLABRA2 expression modulator-like [Iris pallida]